MTDTAQGGLIRTPWFHGWNIVAVCIVAQMAALALTINCFTLFLHGWSAEFHAPVSTLTISVALFSLGAAIASPFIGVAVDRFPARWLFGGALTGLAGFHLLMSFATAGWQVVALYVAILPLAVGLSASVPCQAAVSRWFQHGRIGLAMGVTAMGMELGGVIFPRLIAAELPLVGWRTIFQVAAAVIALVILPLVFVMMRNPSDAEGAAHREAHGVAEGAETGPTITIMDILKRWNFWIVIAAFLPIQSVAMAMLLNLAPVAASRGFDAKVTGGFLIVWSLASMAAKATAGALADKFGNRLPLVGTAVLSACGAALLAFAGSQSLLFGAGVILIGFSGAIWTLSASAMAAEFGAAGFGRAFGLICALVPIASFAPPIFAKVQEMSGTYFNGLIGLAALTLIGAVAAALMKENRAAMAAAASRVRVAH